MFLRKKSNVELPPTASISSLNMDNVSVRYSRKHAPVLKGMALDIRPGEFVSILGRSGAGKTTAFRAIAGFERVMDGYIRIDGRLVSSNFLHVSPEKRNVGLVFQDYALFPNMDVERNIAFACRDIPSSKQRRAVEEMLDVVGIAHLRSYYPNELSGGQQQRVAFARAMVRRPSLLLLDEPFSNVDGPNKAKLRDELSSTVKQFGITTIMVTHNREDALSLSDSVAIMCDGSIRQYGDPSTVYRFPCSSDVATVCGPCNFIEGIYDNGKAVTGMGVLAAQATNGTNPQKGTPVSLLIRPTDIKLSTTDEENSGRVLTVQFKGNTLEYSVRLPSNETVKVITLNDEIMSVGTSVKLGTRTNQPFPVFASANSK